MPHEIRITHPDRPDIRIGPIHDQHQATGIAVNLQAQRDAPETIITVRNWKPGGPSLPLIPADPRVIAVWMAPNKVIDPVEQRFPDLRTRLWAQYPGPRAAQLWEKAVTIAARTQADTGTPSALPPAPTWQHPVEPGSHDTWLRTRLMTGAIATAVTLLALATPSWLGYLAFCTLTGIVAGHVGGGWQAFSSDSRAVVRGLYLAQFLITADTVAQHLH
ncbi:hypothetical protein ACFC58_06720 [Kitasatospora purpeofusca]|uniref:hypothetical protein n=1 Tax=Kitasatospora purpeofusca TaxID=67352 RepID=UPI0035D6E24E